MSDPPEIEFSARAYCKMVLHAAKYPHCAVNGLLLTKHAVSSSSSSDAPPPSRTHLGTPPDRLTLVDAVPLFHQIHGLSPMVEVALTQVEAVARQDGLRIAGYYHANELIKDSSVDAFSQKIADKISENAIDVGCAVLVTVDNRRLGLVMDQHALIVQRSINFDGNAKWKSTERSSIGMEPGILETASDLVQRGAHRDIVDYDNHLDDLAKDFLNAELNEAYDI